MSGHVASQTKILPFPQGVRLAPSGHLPSDLLRVEGSNSAGILVAEVQ